MLQNHALKRKCSLLLACLMLAAVLTACANADFVGNSYRIDDSITVEFKVLNSSQTQSIELQSGDTVRFDVERKSGRLDLSFGIRGASPDYEGKSVESGSFTVTVHESGRYILTVTGAKAKGSVRLTKEA